MSLNDSNILEAVDLSILDTIEAFIRFRTGFHGDTGMRDYLYHQLMTRLPGGGLFTPDAEYRTLLAQAEWYTKSSIAEQVKDHLEAVSISEYQFLKTSPWPIPAL